MMISIQVFINATPLRTRSEIDEWLDVIVNMRDSSGVTRYVGILGDPYMEVMVRSKDVDACFSAMSSAFGDTMPTSIGSIMELRGIFADEAATVLSYLNEHRETFVDLLDVDRGGSSIQDVYEVIVDGLQIICDNGSGSGILVFD